MKFLLSVAAVIAVAVAVPAQRGLVGVAPAGPVPAPEMPEPIAVGPAIIDSFEPIAVGPAIIDFEPIAVGPALIDSFEPISVGPAIIDFPIPDGGVVAEPVVAPSPVAIVDGAAAPADVSAGAPLVQIILNINQAAAEASPIAVGPAIIPEVIQPTPVHVVDSVAEPVQVVEVAPVPAEPVQVVEAAPVPVEPVVIGTPVLPEAAVVLPEELN
uniref:Cuticle protein n=1 Tax=Heliothis virescens TaxID=7102 RepID=A0A2A4IY80_HELVI